MKTNLWCRVCWFESLDQQGIDLSGERGQCLPMPWMYCKTWIPGGNINSAAIIFKWPLEVLQPETPCGPENVFHTDNRTKIKEMPDWWDKCSWIAIYWVFVVVVILFCKSKNISMASQFLENGLPTSPNFKLVSTFIIRTEEPLTRPCKSTSLGFALQQPSASCRSS